jgi:hypothetical protein
MGSYTLSQRTSDGTAAAAAWEIRAGSKGARLLEVGIILADNVGTPAAFGLGRPQAIGLVPTAPVTFLTERKGKLGIDFTEEAAVAAGAVAWGTGPTVPTAYLRRGVLPGAAGDQLIWELRDSGIWIPASGSIVVWNIGTNPVADVWARLEQ